MLKIYLLSVLHRCSVSCGPRIPGCSPVYITSQLHQTKQATSAVHQHPTFLLPNTWSAITGQYRGPHWSLKNWSNFKNTTFTLYSYQSKICIILYLYYLLNKDSEWKWSNIFIWQIVTFFTASHSGMETWGWGTPEVHEIKQRDTAAYTDV